jgi:hypothetical protein
MKKLRVPKNVKAMDREALEQEFVLTQKWQQAAAREAMGRYVSDADMTSQLRELCKESSTWIGKLSRFEAVSTIDRILRAKAVKS